MILGYVIWFFSFIYPNEHQVEFYQTCLTRGYGLMIVGYVAAKRENIPLAFEGEVLRKMNVRNMLMIFFGWNLALSQFYLPLPIVHTISGAGSIFVFVVDYFLNGVGITAKQLVGVIVGFVGLSLTVNGNIIMHYFHPEFEQHSDFQNYRSYDALVILSVALLLVFANVCWAFSIVTTKTLQAHPYLITYHQGILMMLTSAIIYLFNRNVEFDLGQELMTFVFTGLPTALTVLIHITAVKMTTKTGILFIFNFSNVALGYVMSIFYYHESQNPICTVGVISIMAGVLYAVYHKGS